MHDFPHATRQYLPLFCSCVGFVCLVTNFRLERGVSGSETGKDSLWFGIIYIFLVVWDWNNSSVVIFEKTNALKEKIKKKSLKGDNFCRISRDLIKSETQECALAFEHRNTEIDLFKSVKMLFYRVM